MPVNVVLEGAYKGKTIMNPTGKPYISTGLVSTVDLNKDTIESYEVITEDTRKSASSGMARGLVGGALFGPVGMLAGGLSAKSKKSFTLIIQFKDGQKSLIEVDDIIYKSIVGKML